eukprot:scaffold145_cov261-Pinguiococcus_pyrenoidosus.AAC.25
MYGPSASTYPCKDVLDRADSQQMNRPVSPEQRGRFGHNVGPAYGVPEKWPVVHEAGRLPAQILVHASLDDAVQRLGTIVAADELLQRPQRPSVRPVHRLLGVVLRHVEGRALVQDHHQVCADAALRGD